MQGKQMETTAECWQALLDGHKLCNQQMEAKYVELIGGFLYYSNGVRATQPFFFPEDWHIYEEPKWYEDIPEGDVLCWVSDFNPKPRAGYSLKVITGHDGNAFYDVFGTRWKYATRLTEEEIRVFLNNAPEEE